MHMASSDRDVTATHRMSAMVFDDEETEYAHTITSWLGATIVDGERAPYLWIDESPAVARHHVSNRVHLASPRSCMRTVLEP